MSEDKLDSVDGKVLNGYRLEVYGKEEGRFKNEINFNIDLVNEEGVRCGSPCIEGKFFKGRNKHYLPWMDIYYRNKLDFNSENINIKNGIDEKLFKELSKLLPAGSRLMIAYSNHDETFRGLNLDFPPSITYIGYLLWISGFKWFKDWYFAEGFKEGHIKLQGNKPINEENRNKNLLEQKNKIRKFLKKENPDEQIFNEAKDRADKIIREIENEIKN